MKMIAVLAAVVVTVVMFAAAYAQQDITPPVLASVSFEPGRIDTSTADQTITVTAIITDDLSGFSHGWIHYRHPDTTQGYAVWLDESNLTKDSHYVGTFTLPRYSAYGAWSMRQVELHDTVGNMDVWRRPADNAQIGTEVWPARFETFTFTNGPTDTDQTHLLYMPVAIR